MPGRPTKKWWDACVAGVSSHGGAHDPKAVCGAGWRDKPKAEREALVAAQEHRRRHGDSVRAHFDPKTYSHELTELDLYIDSDGEMYRLKQPYIRSVRDRLRSGRYDPERAPALWLPWVTTGAKRYAKEFGINWQTKFPLPLREHLAKAVARHEVGRIERGEYD